MALVMLPSITFTGEISNGILGKSEMGEFLSTAVDAISSITRSEDDKSVGIVNYVDNFRRPYFRHGNWRGIFHIEQDRY